MFFSDPPGSDDSDAGPVGPKAPRPAKPRRRFRWLRRVLVVVAVVTVVALAATGIYVGSVSKSFTNNVTREQLLPTRSPSSDKTTEKTTGRSTTSKAAPKASEALNYVLMGTDSRDPGDPTAGRSDSLMILHLGGDRKSAHLISFPRDMYVDIPGHGKNKINAAFSFGGPALAVETLQNLVDVDIDHVALIDFQGFIDLTTELGGVTVDNKRASRSGEYVFPKGQITIEGEEALTYVRERKNLPNGDLDRAERQRAVIQAVIAKGLSRSTLSNPAKLNAFVSTMAKHLTVDEGFTDSEIIKTAGSLRLSPGDLTSLQAPISGFATIGGQSVDVVDEAGLEDLSQALEDDTMTSYVASLRDR